jgi:orotidine-5'-phosphate decarboxylase
MLTMHASGGAEMLRAAASIPNRALLFGVTVLTSVGGDVQREELRLARLSKECGLDGVVASPHEIRLLREALGEKFLIVAPGIRPAWADAGDERRVMTPAEAVAAGADYIVMGRPIITAMRSVEATQRVLSEIATATSA